MALTRRQREVLDFITEFIDTRRYSPSLEEIAEHFGLSSVATVHKHVTNLEKKGFIRRDWNRSRSIDVVQDQAPRRIGPPAGETARDALLGAHGYGPSLVEPRLAPGESFAGASVASESRLGRAVDFPGAVESVRDELEPLAGLGLRDVPGISRLPMRGRVAAGLPIEAVEDGESVAVPSALTSRGRCYVLQVSGDSMIDEQVRDGDFVIVEERSSVRDGEKVIAMIDGEATLKTFHRGADGSIRLQPANEAYEPIVVRDGQLDIKGVVIGLMRKYRP